MAQRARARVRLRQEAAPWRLPRQEAHLRPAALLPPVVHPRQVVVVVHPRREVRLRRVVRLRREERRARPRLVAVRFHPQVQLPVLGLQPVVPRLPQVQQPVHPLNKHMHLTILL